MLSQLKDWYASQDWISSLDLTGLSNLSPQMLVSLGVGAGVLVVFFGVSGALAGASPAARRMHVLQPGAAASEAGADLIANGETDPTGLLRAFVPSSRTERTRIARKLRQAGAYKNNAVRNYYLVRTTLGIILPVLFVILIFWPDEVLLPFNINRAVDGLDAIQTFQILTVLVAAGFFGPSLLLKWRINRRQEAIKNALPNALDLLQVAVEAGMGFDAALLRVAREMAKVSPALSDEFTMMQMEIQAGKDRDRAFLDMADRTGVEEVGAFANVVLQSVQFGTSISDALRYFAQKMREDRELRAQEKANKLPVKMSGVMAGLMMPTLLMICLSPVLIRWIRVFGEGG